MLYTEEGYLNFDYIRSKGAAINVIIGGRGIGKTYGCILDHLKRMQPFLFLRRTQTQVDIISNKLFNPVLKVALDEFMECEIKPIPKTKATQCLYNERLICVNAALSTFANMRGWSGDGITSIVYDEFIPSPGERPIKDEGHAFLHCYETIARNRELQGREYIPVFLLANAFDFTADILRVLGISETVERMRKKGKEEKIINRSGVKIYIVLPHSPISEKKKETVLYKVSDDIYRQISIDNVDRNITSVIRYKPLTEYKLHVSTDDFAIYRHKSNNTYYVTAFTVKAKPHYTDDQRSRARFRDIYRPLLVKYLAGGVFFSSRLYERLFVEWLTKS